MKVYDIASKLASEIKNSKEYINFRKCMNEVKADSNSDELLKKYKTKQIEMQTLSMSGSKLDRKKQKEMADLQVKVFSNDKIKRYFEAEHKFTTMMDNINKIIANTVNEGNKL